MKVAKEVKESYNKLPASRRPPEEIARTRP
jgi:hypothetical protein